MARKEIDIGIVGNDGTGDSIREAFRKVNDNFREIYAIFGLGGSIKIQDLDNVITEEREVFPLVTASGQMIATVTPIDGTAAFTRSITSSNNVTDEYTCVSTIGMSINDKIVFSGNVFGNVIGNSTYYINSIVDGFKFTISTTQDGLGVNRVLTSDNIGQNVKPRTMVGEDGISVDLITDPERIVISNKGGKLSADTNPSLGYPLNAGGNIIANLGNPTQLAVNAFNNLFGNDGVFITTNDVAITKGFADKNYIRKSGGGGGAGGQIRGRFEPPNKDEYTFTISEFSTGNAVIPNHGYDSAIDGATYVYDTDGTPSTGLYVEIPVTDSNFVIGRTYKIISLGTTNFVTLGASNNRVGEVFTSKVSTATGSGIVKPVYFIRYVNINSFSLHYTANDATGNTNRILVSRVDPDATETLTDAYLDIDLAGNWASNEVLPRTSVVRRQGDSMTGLLNLSDHPFPFDGVGTPNSPFDLQAATKYYVDNSSFTSELNLYVSTRGSDNQTDTPPGKEGRSLAYAFATVGKACEFAEHYIKNSDNETGPYRQLIAYNNGASLSVVSEYTPASPGGIAIIRFTNYNGIRVDQGTIDNEDISPGKLLVGRLSGAKGIISKYYGDDGTNRGLDYLELIDVVGVFEPGENLEFGNNIKNTQITIHVESGIYEEDYPIKLSSNVAIVGDEFRRVLIRPKDRISRSPWVDTWFFRNVEFDSMTIVNYNDPEPKIHYANFELDGWYSHHYYKKPGRPLNPGPKYANPGNYVEAADLISANRVLIQQQVVIYITGLGSILSVEEETKSIRDTGFIIDAILSDLIEGGNEKIVNLQEVFSEVTTLPANCRQGILYIATYINASSWFEDQPAEVKTLITNMINRLYFGFSPEYNTPKNNKDIDVFLCDDASIIRQVTCQGHGGFMMVLDPDGQILTKSPYCQQSGSFSGSINKQAFRGGQYIDGFTGNLTVKVLGKLSNYRLRITDIPREPEVPTSFYINGERYKVNSWIPSTNAKTNAGKIMSLNKSFIEAQCVSYLDSFGVKYNLGQFRIYIGLVIDSVIFDTINIGNIKTTRAARKFFNLDDLSLRFTGIQAELMYDALDYIKNNLLIVLANSVNNIVQINQDEYTQIVDPTLSVEAGSNSIVTDLMDNLLNVFENGIEEADELEYPEFILNLDPSSSFSSLNATSVTLITPGNTSMLSNDYTQVNDLGYGIVAVNKGLAECVSVFSYYCWTSMYSGFGGQIRSLNSSSANGEYGLVAIGADPLEVPDIVNLTRDMIQVMRVVRIDEFENENNQDTLAIFVKDWQYYPLNVSIVEINHGGSIGQVRYEMSNVTVAKTDANGNPTVLKLNLNTSGNNDSSTSGLRTNLVHEQNIMVRGGQNFEFYNVFEVNPIRPSTALTFEGDPDLDNAPVYRVISYIATNPIGGLLNPTGIPDKAILVFDTTYNYVTFTIDRPRTTISDPLNSGRTLGSQTGDRRVAVRSKTGSVELARINSGQMITAWDGKLHRVVEYESALDNGTIYGIITLTEFGINVNASPVETGIQSPINIPDQTLALTLRAGLQAGEQANIKVRISTLRATGHDFLDIGTGGYNSSNYPGKIFGAPRPSIQANEVVEISSGRVFYVSTDQNGFFRVGRFFTVDQGTGTVKFAASIALSNLDGIGFKRGVEIAEFSDDETFADLASDAVPTEAAVDGYVSRRLGLRRDGSVLANNQKLGPGYLALNGTLQPVSTISWGGQRLTSLADPAVGSDATNKNYVDSNAIKFDSLSKKVDTITTTAEKGDILVSFGNVNGSDIIKGFAHAKVVGDITTSLISGATSTLTVAIPASGSINFITLANATNFPASGYVLIDQEVFYYALKSGNKLDTVRRLSESDEIQNAVEYQLDYKFQRGFPNSHAVGATVLSLNKLELTNQIANECIVNSDISPTAAIAQSKLNMRKADTFVEADSVAGWNSTNKTQADLGLAKFSADNFDTNNGYVRVKQQGIAKTDIETSLPNTIMGNLDRNSSFSPIDLVIKDVLKRGFYDNLRTAISPDGKRYVWGIINLSTEEASTQLPIEVTQNAVGNSIVYRTSEGHIQVSTIENDDGGPILSSSGGTASTVYKGNWTAFSGATLRATSADIWHTSRTFSIGNASRTINGSSDASWTTSELGIDSISYNDQIGISRARYNYPDGGKLYPDEDFAYNKNNIQVYNNLGNGAVEHVYITGLTTPNSSGRAIKISYSGGGASPGYGGFYFANMTRANARFVTRFVAKIPVGRQVDWASNAIGNGGMASWLTPQAGTGKYEEYAVEVVCGVDGTFSSTNFFYISTGANTAFDWYLASATVIDCTDKNTIGTRNISTGDNSYPGTITGAWNLSQSSKINFTSGTLQSTTLTTGDAATAGTITGTWTLTSGSKLQATYADLAEWYTSDKKYEPGTVLVFGGWMETTTTNQLSDTRVAGVVTTNPAYTMNDKLADNSNSVCIALQGRVPCKVIGRVQKGDLLTTSAIPGCAIRATSPVLGSIIGKALENKDSLESGIIEIAVGRM